MLAFTFRAPAIDALSSQTHEQASRAQTVRQSALGADFVNRRKKY
jgi:hypothetical protein